MGREKNKSREEIPKWTWYNGQFLFQFDEKLRNNPCMTISEFFKSFSKTQGLQKNLYHTKNQGTMILLLYGLLVVPKEIWEKKKTRFEFTTKKYFKCYDGKECKEMTTIDFLRLLRNSLAHANFSIDTTEETFYFWNIKPDRGKKNEKKNKGEKKEKEKIKNFEVKISYKNLGDFITEIGKYYINEVSSIE